MKFLIIQFTFLLVSFTPVDLQPIFRQVSNEYSVSYELLSKMADIESNFRPNAKASTSSAKGLYQIINSTENWLREICDIEGDIFDPLTNTRLGACLIQHNTKYFRRKMKREPNFTELYILHFYGGYTGLKFIRLVKSKGSDLAYKHFRRESRANPNIFFKRARKPRKLIEVMELFRNKVRNGRVL